MGVLKTEILVFMGVLKSAFRTPIKAWILVIIFKHIILKG